MPHEKLSALSILRMKSDKLRNLQLEDIINDYALMKNKF
jgi:hypothetical protein